MSGSDVAGVVRAALMRPIRTLQTATHFKPAPKAAQRAAKARAKAAASGGGGGGEGGKPVMLPCGAGEAGAVAMSVTDLSPEQVVDPGLRQDILRSDRTPTPEPNLVCERPSKVLC